MRAASTLVTIPPLPTPVKELNGDGYQPGVRARFEESLELLAKAGAEIVEVDKKSFQAVMGPVYDKFMTTPDMKRLVKTIQDTK